ncbi:MAG: transglutaminase domain-containing protein [Paenibacillaceae bacterium]
MKAFKSRLFLVSGFLIRHWERRLTLLFVGLFILQFIRWFAAEEGGWLPLTVQSTVYAILVVFVVMLPVRMWLWLRFSLQFIGVLIVNLLAVDYQFIRFKINSLQQFAYLLRDNFQQLHPYVWFILGTWLAYLFLFWWVKVKWRIGFLVFASVVAIAVRDSFSVNYLWSQAAMMIFCGLCLLVIHHFAILKRKNPSSWAYISEYPGALVLPVVLILGLTMLLGSLAPDVSNLLTDPYTLYKSWKGEVVEKVIKKNGSYSASAAASTGNSSSGYSRNDEILGGGFDFDYSLVMKIDSSKRSYWRGETLSVYTGAGWKENTGDYIVHGSLSDDPLPHDPRIDISKLKTVDVQQTVTFENNTKYPVLFGAYSISNIVSINGEKPSPNMLNWVSKENELRWKVVKRADSIAFPETYTLVSKVPVIDVKGLEAITAPPGNLAELSEYLELPKSLPSRVIELANTITATATTQYDKVKAIEDYLRITYPYTNRPNLKLGTSKDFVDRFLFEIKEGYCDYFSTAMAVLTRSIGVPTRWVKGYTAGSSTQDEVRQRGYLSDGLLTDFDGADVFSVRNSNAHSWVEVYFEGYGWLPFEATSGYVIPRVLPENEKAPVPDVEATPALAAETSNKQTLGLRDIVLAFGGLVIVLGLTYMLLRTRIKKWYRRFSIVQLRKQRKANNSNDQVVHEFSRLLRFLRRKGISTEEYETAREMFIRLSDRKGWLKKEFETILSLFEKAKYSGKSVTPDELKQATMIFKRLRQEI